MQRLGRGQGILYLLLFLFATFVGFFAHVVRVTGKEMASVEVTPIGYLPLVHNQESPPPFACPNTSANSYSAGPAFQLDLDDPVRPTQLHADKNIELRGYAAVEDTGLTIDLINLGSDDPNQPPQLATLFKPNRVPLFDTLYRINHWIWAPSPDAGVRGGPIEDWPVTALGLRTTPGEILHVPSSSYDIGGGMEAVLLFADIDTVTLHIGREDSAATGYTLHIDRLCTDPNLLALYDGLNEQPGPRYVFVHPNYRPYAYDLPNLPAGQELGTAIGGEIVVAIVDSGSFMDPRSCNEWWQIRPAYGTSCSRP